MATPLRRLRRVAALELLVILAAILYYELGNFLLRADPTVAYQHAIGLLHLEQGLGLFVEPNIQASFNAWPLLLWVLIFFYVGPHFGLTLGFLLWAYRYRYAQYPLVRNAFLVFTFLAFGFQWLYPLSPPRLVADSGMADSIDQTLPVSGNTDWVMRFTNPYAALPSVHFGWALLIAVLAIQVRSGGRHRWWWLTYPGAIALSILATGNHWILDLVLSVAFIAATYAVIGVADRLSRPSAAGGSSWLPNRPSPVPAQAEPADAEGSDA